MTDVTPIPREELERYVRAVYGSDYFRCKDLARYALALQDAMRRHVNDCRSCGGGGVIGTSRNLPPPSSATPDTGGPVTVYRHEQCGDCGPLRALLPEEK